jgi:hypothetical protein
MSIKRVCSLAECCHKHCSRGKGVSKQTKKAQRVCREWQERVLKEFPSARFEKEVPLGGRGARQRIDLVDWITRTAFELKVSPNNTHMEVYKDVFKALVYNIRNPRRKLRHLVFIAPAAGIDSLGTEFPKDVAAITQGLKLKFSLKKI